MQIRDLGAIAGPVWLFGGVCSNLSALQAFLTEAERAGIGAGQMISTGDLVGYSAHAAEVVALARARGFAAIAGNVERQLAAGAGDCGCGFAPGSTCDRLSAGWYSHARHTLGAEALEWMAELPDMAVFSHEGRRYAVVHGGLTDISRFLWPSTPDEEFRQEIHAITAAAGPIDGVVAGHSGLAFQRMVDGVHWINAGSLGLPPHDGRAETRYAVLAADGVRVHRLTYAHEDEARAMRAAGLVQGYERTLETGIWPSEEVLPEALRRAPSAS